MYTVATLQKQTCLYSMKNKAHLLRSELFLCLSNPSPSLEKCGTVVPQPNFQKLSLRLAAKPLSMSHLR